ncbi:hypothetical protein BGZ57DRAFT_713642, partial [Hyaloscypha finlandica]
MVSYIDIWNHHRIRKDLKRKYYIVGIPAFLYEYAAIKRYRIPVDEGLLAKLDLLILLPIDINEYLPYNTLIWCKSQLIEIGINPLSLIEGSSKPDSSRLYIKVYCCLRLTIRRHISNRN